MSERMRSALASYAREVSQLARAAATTEPSYYPAIKGLLEACLKEIGLPLSVRTNTRELRRGGGADLPDFAMYDGVGDFVVVFVEAKGPSADMRSLAASEEHNNQIGRSLSQTASRETRESTSFARLLFKRSSTAFAGWLLHKSEWHADEFDWTRTGEYLRIPLLAGLFHEFSIPLA